MEEDKGKKYKYTYYTATVKEENDGRRVFRNARNPDIRKGRKSENKKLSKGLWQKDILKF